MASRSICDNWASLSRELLFALALVLIAGSTQASRELHQQLRLQAYSDPGSNEARHAPPVKSFLVSDGSWVDCIPIEGQIAAHHPSLKDHVIQVPPSLNARPSSLRHPQLFAREHGGCPEGSIPVLRDDPSRYNMPKTAPPASRKVSENVAADHLELVTPSSQHEYAVTGVPKSPGAYSGTSSVFSVNGPTLGSSSDMSLSQFWIVDGSYDDKSLSTIEVGWQTQPRLHPTDDANAPHLFIYWTNNAYGMVGPGSCYNLLCAGFVQWSNTWVMGGVMPHYTTLDQHARSESEVAIQVLYFPTGNSWWLYLDREPIGYWPRSIYANGYMQGTCNQVQWGGEVAFYKEPGVATHSTTAMGSGAFPVENWPKAAYQRNITYFDATLRALIPGTKLLNDERRFDNPLCYDIQVQLSSYTNWGTYFFFGGSGGANKGCHY